MRQTFWLGMVLLIFVNVCFADTSNKIEQKYKIYTGIWDRASSEKKQPFLRILGSDQDSGEFHRLYFQWYNLVHELAHIVRRYNGIGVDWGKNGASEEQAANDFAVAYWKMFGEKKKLAAIKVKIEDILNRINDPVPPGVDMLDYYNSHFNELQSVEKYGFLQFSSFRRALQSKETFYEVLGRFGFKDIKVNKRKKLIYSSDTPPQKIVEDCCGILEQMGIITPVVEVILLDDPAIQYEEP